MAITDAAPATADESQIAPGTETTRLLCAAAYTDGTFAQEVVEQILEDDYRAVEVPPGVDPLPVIKHCLMAFRRKTLRDWVLAANLLIVVLYVVIVVGSGLVLNLALASGILAYLVAHSRRRLLRWVLIASLMACTLVFLAYAGTYVFVLASLVAWATVAYDVWHATYRVVTKELNARSFDAAAAPAMTSSEFVRRTDDLVERQAGNLTVYSGFLPFAGAGVDLGGWSFLIDLRKGTEGLGHPLQPQLVEPLVLYEGVEHAVRDLGMSKLTIEDRAFVNGTDIRDDRAVLPSPTGRPSTTLSDAALRRLMVAPTHRVRHYTCIRVTDWRGELVLSLYVRFAVGNGRLFCELNGFLLLPLKPELHRCDGISPRPELEDLLWLAGRSLVQMPALLLRSPSAALRPLLRQRRRAKQLRAVERNVFFDYGAPVTVLDRVRSTDYARYFQMLDKEMYAKVLERTVLDAVVSTLDAHGVDTGEIVERRTTIINNGLMVQGGSVEATNVAVGSAAQIGNWLTGGGKPSGASEPDFSARAE
jgi:hypothetical protein